jgi:UDP:flavonoid glycosyltransferase YjiC (YdhE family)
MLATSPFHRPVVEAAGVPFHPLHPDVDPDATDLIRRIMDPARGSEVVIRELLAPATRAQYDDLFLVVSRADVVVAHPVTFAARIAAEEARVPWLSTVLAPLSFFSVSDFPALPNAPWTANLGRFGPWAARGLKRVARTATRDWTAPVRALREARGLPPAGDPLYEGQFSPDGTLALFSPVIGAPQADWPARTETTGFVWYNGPGASLAPELASFLDRGEPPIVFTLGSSAVAAAGRFYEESASAARMLGRRAVLLAGSRRENRPAQSSPDILIVESAPHEQLFSRASAIVHHGGVGTTGQALRAGRPMLVVPFAHDQPDNASRVKRLGAARVLYPRRYTSARVAENLDALLTQRTYADRAGDVGRIVRAERGVDAACEAIVRLGSA